MQRIHFAGFACDMHRNDGAGAIGNPPFGIRGIDVEAARHAVAEHRPAAKISHHFGGGGEGIGGHEDFIAGTQSDAVERQLQRGGAGIQGQRVLAAHVGSELFLKLDGDRPGGEPAGIEYALHRFALFFTE